VPVSPENKIIKLSQKDSSCNIETSNKKPQHKYLY